MKSTKELARELGILRKRSRLDPLSTNPNKRGKHSLQVFDYLIVIDFESTCWEDAKQRTQEIIEFPAVLLNTESGEIENEFHHYVQPQECPLLSDFCKQLTGISQDSVDNGIPLDLCLRRFTCWLAELTKKKTITYNVTTVNEHEKTCTFVTWSDWDLAVCLQYECRRKQFRKPRELNSWIDLRATYRKFYGRKPHGLNGALQEIGVTFEGREHSGLHDARNTARLAWHMMKDGCIMQITKTLPATGSSCPLTSSKLKIDSPIKKISETKRVVGSSNQETEKRQPTNIAENSSKNEKLHTCAVGKTDDVESNSSNETPAERLNPVASLNFENSAALAELCSLNMVDWFDDDVDFGEVFTEQRVTITEPSDSCVSPQHRVNDVKSHFSVFTECGSHERELSSAVRERKPRVLDAIKDVTNVLSVTARVQQFADFSSKSTPLIRHGADKSTPVVLPVQSRCAVGESPFRVSNSSSFRPPQNVVGCVRTPAAVASMKPSCGVATASPSCWKTPSNVTPLAAIGTLMKKTSPLCDCGCRSKRKFVQRPGPNLGRTFFCCGSSSASKTACRFFKWEEPTTSPATLSNTSADEALTSSWVESPSYSTTLDMHVTPCSIRPHPPPVTRVLVPPARPLQRFSLL